MKRSFVWFIALMIALPSSSSSQGRQTEVEVKKLTATILKDLITKRGDRSLIVNVWATWCVPCVEEFPELIALDKSYASKGLDVVVVSLDEPEEISTKVLPLLRRMDARMPAYINAFEPSTGLIDALHPKWSGAIPATFVFDRNGAFVEMAVGQQTRTEFDEMVKRSFAPSR